MDSGYILFEKNGPTARIVLNRPDALNSLNRQMIEEIGRALDESERDRDVRVVVITGAGRAFCTGTDLKSLREEATTPWLEQEFFRFINRTVLQRIEDLGKPVIAAVNGYALAGGFELMLACDFVVASVDAVIGDQHINVGLIGAAGTTYRTTRLVGIRRAKEIILLGKRMSGKEAESLGLINSAVPAGELSAHVDALAAQLAQKSPIAVRISKALINRALQADPMLSMDLEIFASTVNASTEDHDEGIRAFNEKRNPVFKGR